MTNFLEETKYAIEASKHSVMDIIYIGSLDSGYCCDWNTFADIANKEYDSGYGGDKRLLAI